MPRIHFGVGTGELLGPMAAAGADVVGVDWRLPLDEAAPPARSPVRGAGQPGSGPARGSVAGGGRADPRGDHAPGPRRPVTCSTSVTGCRRTPIRRCCSASSTWCTRKASTSVGRPGRDCRGRRRSRCRRGRGRHLRARRGPAPVAGGAVGAAAGRLTAARRQDRGRPARRPAGGRRGGVGAGPTPGGAGADRRPRTPRPAGAPDRRQAPGATWTAGPSSCRPRRWGCRPTWRPWPGCSPRPGWTGPAASRRCRLRR